MPYVNNEPNFIACHWEKVSWKQVVWRALLVNLSSGGERPFPNKTALLNESRWKACMWNLGSTSNRQTQGNVIIKSTSSYRSLEVCFLNLGKCFILISHPRVSNFTASHKRHLFQGPEKVGKDCISLKDEGNIEK